MKYVMGYCGVECSKCPAYIAMLNNDDELRRRYAAEQSEFYSMEILSERINCVGCLEEGEHLGYCSMCEIRRCCRERGLETCAECDDYVCEELEKVYTVMNEVFGKAQDGVAEAKINLDRIRFKQKGTKQG
jgi:hypothetical protein